VWHFSAIIAALGQAGEWQPALQLLEELKQLHTISANPSLKPNTVTYSSAVAAVAKGQRLDLAILLYNEMIAAGTWEWVLDLNTNCCSNCNSNKPHRNDLHALSSRGPAGGPGAVATYTRPAAA